MAQLLYLIWLDCKYFLMSSRFLFEATGGGSKSKCPHGKRQNPKQKDSKEGIVSLGSCSKAVCACNEALASSLLRWTFIFIRVMVVG